jgi:hypothetical protein
MQLCKPAKDENRFEEQTIQEDTLKGGKGQLFNI